MAKWWSSLGQSEFEYSIQFYGVSTNRNPAVMVSIQQFSGYIVHLLYTVYVMCMDVLTLHYQLLVVWY